LLSAYVLPKCFGTFAGGKCKDGGILSSFIIARWVRGIICGPTRKRKPETYLWTNYSLYHVF